MCACFLAAELLRVVCFHRLHSLSLPPRAEPSAPGPALGPSSGSANSLAGGSNASRAPRPPDPQLRTCAAAPCVWGTGAAQAHPAPSPPSHLVAAPSSRRSGQRRGRVSRCPSRPGRHEVLWAPPSESSQNLSVLPTSTASVPTTVVCGLLLASPPRHIPSSPVLFHPKGKMCNIM